MKIKDIIQFIKTKHFDQLDKAGQMYYLHPLRVCENAEKLYISLIHNNSDEYLNKVRVCALCHDLYEDTDVTDEELLSLGITQDCIDIIKTKLTHKRGVPYKDYISNLADNNIAIIVKLADLKDNLDLTRLHGIKLSELDIKRIQKYMDSYDYLYNLIK